MMSAKYDVTTLPDPHHHFIKRWLNFTLSQPLPAPFTEVEHFHNLICEWHIYSSAKIFFETGHHYCLPGLFKFLSLHSLLFLPNIQENFHLTSESVIIPICWALERATHVNDIQELECYLSKHTVCVHVCLCV